MSTMHTSWMHLALALASVTVSYQQMISVKTSSTSPVEVMESDEVVLRCTIKARGSSFFFQWLLDDNIITNGSNSWDENYVVTISEKPGRRNVFLYDLIIKRVRRTDHGRWTCKAVKSSTQFEKINIIVTVFYTPDILYPICDLQTPSVICKSQEGNPRVSLHWYAQGADDRMKLKPSSLSTVDGMMQSEVLIASLRPPNWLRENVVCETGIGNCSISKMDVYNMTSVSIVTKVTSEDVTVHCNASDHLSEGSVVFERNDTSTEGQMMQEGSYAMMRFLDGGYGYRDEIIYCRYLWGILDYVSDMVEVSVPLPAPIFTTDETTPVMVTAMDDVVSTSTDDLSTDLSSIIITSSISLSDDAFSSERTTQINSNSADISSMKYDESITSSTVVNADVTTPYDSTSGTGNTVSAMESFNTFNTNEPHITSDGVSSNSVAIMPTRATMFSTHKMVTDHRRPTLPLLPPEKNHSPSDWGAEKIALIIIFLVTIFVILLVAVIIYQKWKEKTGTYSLPTTTAPKPQESMFSYKT